MPQAVQTPAYRCGCPRLPGAAAEYAPALSPCCRRPAGCGFLQRRRVSASVRRSLRKPAIRLRSVVTAAHVAREDEVKADLNSAAPRITLAFKPRVKGSLRLFQQRDVVITRLQCGGARLVNSACFFVKRSGHSEQQRPVPQERILAAPPPRRCPTQCASTVKTADDASTGEAWAPSSGACQGKSGCRYGSPQHKRARIWRKRPGGLDSPRRVYAPVHRSRVSVRRSPWQSEAALGEIEFARDVEKRRQQRTFRHFVRIHKLQYAANLDAAFLFGSGVAARQRRICCP